MIKWRQLKSNFSGMDCRYCTIVSEAAFTSVRAVQPCQKARHNNWTDVFLPIAANFDTRMISLFVLTLEFQTTDHVGDQ